MLIHFNEYKDQISFKLNVTGACIFIASGYAIRFVFHQRDIDVIDEIKSSRVDCKFWSLSSQCVAHDCGKQL